MKGSLWTVAVLMILGGIGLAVGVGGASSNADPQNDSVAASIDAVAPIFEPIVGLLLVAVVGAIIIGAGRFQ